MNLGMAPRGRPPWDARAAWLPIRRAFGKIADPYPNHQELTLKPLQTKRDGSSGEAGKFAAYCYAARYVYSDVVVQNDNLLRLTAAEDVGHRPITTSLLTNPDGHPVQLRDRYGNITHRISVTQPHREFTILSIGVVWFEPPTGRPSEVPLGKVEDNRELGEFLAATPLVHPGTLYDKAREIVGREPGLVEAAEAIAGWVNGNIQYVKESTTVATTAAEVLQAGIGVCQDMTHLALGLLRSLGIPCRYVCGLLTTEVGETHAWLEFWHPGQGWVPSDPTRGKGVVGHGELLKFAVGRDYSEASPVEGSFTSRGAGQLDSAIAQVRLERDRITFEDAYRLLEESRFPSGPPG